MEEEKTMQVVSNTIKQGSISEFAIANGLTMVVVERTLPIGDPSRFYAKFDQCDVQGDGVLVAEYGNGATPEEAIEAYAQKISLKTLILNGLTNQERRFSVWRLAPKSAAMLSSDGILLELMGRSQIFHKEKRVEVAFGSDDDAFVFRNLLWAMRRESKARA